MIIYVISLIYSNSGLMHFLSYGRSMNQGAWIQEQGTYKGMIT